jgi:hypothetical protein
VQLGGLGKLEKFKPAIFQLVAQCLNQLYYHMPPPSNRKHFKTLYHQQELEFSVYRITANCILRTLYLLKDGSSNGFQWNMPRWLKAVTMFVAVQGKGLI